MKQQLLSVLLILIFCIFNIKAYRGVCSVYKNNFIDLSNVLGSSNFTQITTSFCESNTNGFSAFSLSKSSNPKDIICDYFYHKTKRYFGSETKNCSGELDETVFNYIRGSWDFTTVSIKIPKLIVNSTNFIIFRCSDDVNNFTNIFATLDMKKSFHQCNSFYCSKTFGSVNLYYYIFEQSILGVFVLLSIIALWRNWQPFKSRGAIMTMGLFTEFLSGFIDIIPYVASVEFAYRFENNMSMILYIPLKMTGYLLIQIVKKKFKFLMEFFF